MYVLLSKEKWGQSFSEETRKKIDDVSSQKLEREMKNLNDDMQVKSILSSRLGKVILMLLTMGKMKADLIRKVKVLFFTG